VKKVAKEMIDVLAPMGTIIGLWVKNVNIIAKSIWILRLKSQNLH